ncbi:MAG: 23S rRNA (uracil(1939)-C(5))-methyltransferase RlmD [Calditrichaeota bacterium]|nr:23S rRNA (uracil(1939)-C(5))-methyltransferase RlmD [Calditrichota bacterium]
MQTSIKKGQSLTIDIDDLAFGGKGISKIDGFVIFTEDVVPGDKVDVIITRKKSSFAEARVTEYHKRGLKYVDPPCEHFTYCGGCRWQNLDYSEQIHFKQKQVEESLSHIAGLSNLPFLKIIAADPIYSYRNKMEFTFSNKRFVTREEFDDPELDRHYALGLHVPRIFDKVLPIDRCHIQDDIFNGILNMVNSFVKDSGIPVYDLKSHQGVWRFLMLRKGHHSDEYMINIVTSKPVKNELKELIGQLVEHYPQIKSIVNNLNRRVSQTAIGEEEILLYGKATITDYLGPYQFEISANSFFQTNTLQAEKMYDCIKSFLNLTGKELVFDLYCGTGTIPIYLADSVKSVHGFELVESAIADANKNCDRLNIDNCFFHTGDVRYVLPQFADLNPDIIIMDPPRAGLHPDVVESVMDLAVNDLIYVSCNPATLARDINVLKTMYTIEKVQVIDMFPHTYHIETIVKLGKSV